MDMRLCQTSHLLDAVSAEKDDVVSKDAGRQPYQAQSAPGLWTSLFRLLLHLCLHFVVL